MDSVQKQLEEIGLSANEVKAYLASLELGAATAQQIAAKAAVVRPTAYVAIGGLVKRGLMSSHTRGKKQYFQAERPNQLLKLLQEEKNRINDCESRVKSMLPGLEALITSSKEKPEFKFYEGLEGLETMRQILLGSHPDVIYSICNQDAVRKTVPENSIVLYGYRLSKAGISGRQIILCGKTENPKFVQSTKKFQRKIIRTNAMANFAEISMFKDHIALIAYLESPFGVLIKSADIFNVAKTLFNLAWNSEKLAIF